MSKCWLHFLHKSQLNIYQTTIVFGSLQYCCGQLSKSCRAFGNYNTPIGVHLPGNSKNKTAYIYHRLTVRWGLTLGMKFAFQQLLGLQLCNNNQRRICINFSVCNFLYLQHWIQTQQQKISHCHIRQHNNSVAIMSTTPRNILFEWQLIEIKLICGNSHPDLFDIV